MKITLPIQEAVTHAAPYLGNCPGGHSAHTHTGLSVREIFWQTKISVQRHYNPKISANFIGLGLPGHPLNERRNPETMPVEARTAYTEPRNISLTMLCVLKNIMAIISVSLDPKISRREY